MINETNNNNNTNDPPQIITTLNANSNELDLVFVCDCTSSMSSYINSAKQNIRKIAEEIHTSESKDTRYALICYRDHPPQDTTYVTQVFDFTDRIGNLQNNIDTMEAHGGGDIPESVCCALKAALNLEYRKTAVKIIVFIADAPPHGIKERGDKFENGCPDQVDPIAIVEEMVMRDIIIYSVGVEPPLGKTAHGGSFYRGISQKTGGRYVELGNATVLPSIIIGAAQEEIALNKIDNTFDTEMNNIMTKDESKTLTEDEIVDKIHENLTEKGTNTVQMEVTHQNVDDPTKDITEIFFKAKTLEEARAQLKNDAPPARKPTVTHSYGAQSTTTGSSSINKEQVKRMFSKKAKKMGYYDD